MHKVMISQAEHPDEYLYLARVPVKGDCIQIGLNGVVEVQRVRLVGRTELDLTGFANPESIDKLLAAVVEVKAL